MSLNLSRKRMFIAYLYFAIIMFKYSINNTRFEVFGKTKMLVIFIEIIVFILWIIMEKYEAKFLLFMFLNLVIGTLMWITTKDESFFIMLIVPIISTSLEYKKLFKFLFYEKLFITIGIILSSLTGILSMNKVIMSKDGSIVCGYSLGYNHPNQFAYNFGIILLMYICYKNKKINSKDIVTVIISVVSVYQITKSRSLLYIFFMVVTLIYLYKILSKDKMLRKLIKIISMCVLPISIFIALGLPYIMTKATGKYRVLLYRINDILNARMTHSERVFNTYKISFFGGRKTDFSILKSLYGYSVIDNGYLRLLYNFGIFGFAVFILLYIFTVKKLIEKNEYVYLSAIIAIFIWGITENILRSFAINFTVVFWRELKFLIQQNDKMICYMQNKENLHRRSLR